MNRLFCLFLVWHLLPSPLWADASLNAKGVLIITSASGDDPRNVLFSDIAWTGLYGGIVTESDGDKTTFTNRDIGRIIYFDPQYYNQLDGSQDTMPFRSGIRIRESVVQTSFFNLGTSDIETLKKNEANLDAVEHDFPTIQGLIQPEKDQLDDLIGKLSSGQSLINGKWMSQAEAGAQETAPVVGEAKKSFTFTTKDGKRYEDVEASVTDLGLSVLTSNGGTTISFDQLPDNLNNFPESVRQHIREKRQAIIAKASNATHNLNNSLNRTADSTSELPQANDPGSSPANSANNAFSPNAETARAFIEHQLKKSTFYKYSFDKDAPPASVEINGSGQLHIIYSWEEWTCDIKDLDSDSITYAKPTYSYSSGAPAIVIYSHDSKDTISYVRHFTMTINADGSQGPPSDQSGFFNRIELADVPDPDRVCNAFCDLIKAYANSSNAPGDVRDQLSSIVRRAMSVSGEMRNYSVDYDKSNESLVIVFDSLLTHDSRKVIIPFKLIDPQEIKVKPGNDGTSQLLLETLNDALAIQTHINDHPPQLTSTIYLDLPSNDDATAFSDLVTQLCTQLGWKPSKY